jgi:hypothetical protein
MHPHSSAFRASQNTPSQTFAKIPDPLPSLRLQNSKNTTFPLYDLVLKNIFSRAARGLLKILNVEKKNSFEIADKKLCMVSRLAKN